MKLVMHVNDGSVPLKSGLSGPNVGHAFPYWTKADVPVVFDLETFVEMWTDDEPIEPTPGMVVVHYRTLMLYAIDVDGVARPIGMRLPAGYSGGAMLDVELDVVATS